MELSDYKMVSSSVQFDITRQIVWLLMRDLGISHHYVPGLLDTKIVSDNKTGMGAQRRVYTKPEKWLLETVVEWNEGSGFLLSLENMQGGAPGPFSEAFFRYQLSDNPDSSDSKSSCICELTLYFKMRFGLLGSILARLLRGEFEKRNQLIADRLKDYYDKTLPG